MGDTIVAIIWVVFMIIAAISAIDTRFPLRSRWSLRPRHGSLGLKDFDAPRQSGDERVEIGDERVIPIDCALHSGEVLVHVRRPGGIAGDVRVQALDRIGPDR